MTKMTKALHEISLWTRLEILSDCTSEEASLNEIKYNKCSISYCNIGNNLLYKKPQTIKRLTDQYYTLLPSL